jgi:GTP-binding protein
MFVDEVAVALRAGNGGHGCLSFRREKYVPKGGPDGGDGGRGGNLVLRCDRNVGDLVDYKFQPQWRAENGQPGMGSGCHGRNGRDRVLPVPEGTRVLCRETGELLLELLRDGEEHVLLRGGRGGVGNERFKTSTDRAPRKTVPGQPGEEGTFLLEMCLIADAGLVGLPNAGKSSLLNSLTATDRPTGPYPFTTLHPKVGTLLGEAGRITVADIPGLIAGAHRNRGLGCQFLRHVERCPLLVFVLDLGGEEGRDPWDDSSVLCDELGHHRVDLLHRPRICVANKMDLPGAGERLEELRRRLASWDIFPISCRTGSGLAALARGLFRAVGAASVSQRFSVSPGSGDGGGADGENDGVP